MAYIKDGIISFGNIYNQIYRQEKNRTNEFNLMLIGLSGSGKSSLVRSLFKGTIKPKEVDGGPKLNEYSEVLEGNVAKLKLRCVETSNFNSHDPKVYVDYVEDKLKKYFVAQRRQLTPDIEDTRIHCCLYLISHGKMRLENADIECMKALHERVNLIPIISRSDPYNSSQKAKFKENILSDLKRHGINYFAFSFDEKEDEDRARLVKQEAERFPFAVVAADEPVIENNRSRWLRVTDSCIIDISDRKYDFDALSKLLTRHCMLNLIDSTHEKHYAKFKSELLARARRKGYKMLEEIGLEPHEVLCIETILTTGCVRPPLRQQQYSPETQEESQEPRSKLAKLKPTPTKRPVLHEKPEFLRARVADAYRRT